MSDKPHYIDTHCHIHDETFFKSSDMPLHEIIADAKRAGVMQMICVGTDVESSRQALQASRNYDSLYASVALHPHEASKYSEIELVHAVEELKKLISEKAERFVAIGECGLDYFYHSDKEVKDKQKKLLRMHLDMAKGCNLAVIFHVRDAFDDFFAIMEDYPEIQGVLHSFTDSEDNMKKAVKRGLYIGLNGIMTFTSNSKQLEMAKHVPLQSLVIETDAPFLTPKPYRGKICKPEHVVVTAEFLSGLRQESIEQLAQATTQNAKQLFTIK